MKKALEIGFQIVRLMIEMKYTPNEQLSYEVLTACSFGNAITILGLYRNISKLLHYS